MRAGGERVKKTIRDGGEQWGKMYINIFMIFTYRKLVFFLKTHFFFKVLSNQSLTLFSISDLFTSVCYLHEYTFNYTLMIT